MLKMIYVGNKTGPNTSVVIYHKRMTLAWSTEHCTTNDGFRS